MKKKRRGIDFEDILVEGENLPDFNASRLEGRIDIPIGRRTLVGIGITFLVIATGLSARAVNLQLIEGAEYARRSDENRLDRTVIYAERGALLDRRGEVLAESTISDGDPWPHRLYRNLPGLSHVVGYVSYPKRDSSGNIYETEFKGASGAESIFNDILTGTPGISVIESSATGEVFFDGVARNPKAGETVALSIDAGLTSELYNNIAGLADRVSFQGGAGIIMDIQTGEIIAMTSYPEFRSQEFSDGDDIISLWLTDKRTPLVNRTLTGLYTPGSIVKPFVALAALEEGIIAPTTSIYSSGALLLPNPYNPDKPTKFADWKAHGAVDMRRALAVSSNVYFYQIGGGFGDQEGLGIKRLSAWYKKFGFGSAITPLSNTEGVVPSPEWKQIAVPGEPWGTANTYHTSIGQYSMLVTPIQVVRAVAAIANGGKLVTPNLLMGSGASVPTMGVRDSNLQVIREGMRQAAIDGTARGLNIPGVSIAGKTGTAELDAGKQYTNSWVMGFFPYENPRYAFAIVMEKGPRTNLTGATFAMRGTVEWMIQNRPAYLGLPERVVEDTLPEEQMGEEDQ